MNSDESRKKLRNSKRVIIVAIAVFPVLLWAIGSQPLSSRIEASVAWVLVIGMLVWSHVQQKKNSDHSS